MSYWQDPPPEGALVLTHKGVQFKGEPFDVWSRRNNGLFCSEGADRVCIKQDEERMLFGNNPGLPLDKKSMFGGGRKVRRDIIDNGELVGRQEEAELKVISTRGMNPTNISESDAMKLLALSQSNPKPETQLAIKQVKSSQSPRKQVASRRRGAQFMGDYLKKLHKRKKRVARYKAWSRNPELKMEQVIEHPQRPWDWRYLMTESKLVIDYLTKMGGKESGLEKFMEDDDKYMHRLGLNPHITRAVMNKYSDFVSLHDLLTNKNVADKDIWRTRTKWGMSDDELHRLIQTR